MTKNIIFGILVLLFSLIAACILMIYLVYPTFNASHKVVSTDILSEDNHASDEVISTDILDGDNYLYELEDWLKYGYFVNLNPPGGKHYYIRRFDGRIERAKEEIVAKDNLAEDSDEYDYEYEETNTTEALNFTFYSNESGDQITDINNSDEQSKSNDENDDFVLQENYNKYTEESNRLTSNFSYISFVSLDYRLYDICFEFNGIPYMKENEDSIPIHILMRHRLHSFVGPNKKVYYISYNNDNASDIAVTETNPVQYLDHFQLKTFGPYSKWEHTYNFSPNGLQVTSHLMSPVKIIPNHSIPLLEVYPNSKIMDETFLIFNSPSGKMYIVMNDLNIAPFYDNDAVKPSPFISYIGPDGAIYSIYFRIDEQGYHSSIENVGIVEAYDGSSRLLSFVGPDKKLYRVDHSNDTDVTDIPLLVAVPDNQTYKDLKINISKPDERHKYYNRHVSYTFGNDGENLIDREDEFDWTPLYEQPDFDLEEVDADSEVAITAFLSFYSPSGKTYHITTNESEANIAIEKGHQNKHSSYMKFRDSKGRENLIYISPHDDPLIKMEDVPKNTSSNENNTSMIVGNVSNFFTIYLPLIETSPFYLMSFATPYKKLYFVDNIHDNFVIRTERQPIDPLDKHPENCLTITIKNKHTKYIFEFSWSGDKFLNVYAESLYQMFESRQPELSQSLIGGGKFDEKYLKQQRREWYRKKV